MALLLTAVANTAANRRFTFGVRGQAGRARHQLQGLAVFGLGLALTSGRWRLVHATRTVPGGRGGRAGAGQPAATLLRFLLLRGWVFTGRRT